MSEGLDLADTLKALDTLLPNAFRFLVFTALSSLRLFTVLLFFGPMTRLRIPRMYLKSLAVVFSFLAFPFDDLTEMLRGPYIEHMEGSIFLLMLKEMFVGFLLAVMVGIPFWIAGVAGAMIDAQRGGGFSETVSPLSGDDTTVMGILFWLFMATAYFLSGGLMNTLSLLYDSFELWPILSLTPTIDFTQWETILRLLDVVVLNAAIIVLPFVALMLLTDLALFYMSTFIPQLNVFAVSLPVKSGIVAAVMVLYITLIPELIYDRIDTRGLFVSLFGS